MLALPLVALDVLPRSGAAEPGHTEVTTRSVGGVLARVHAAQLEAVDDRASGAEPAPATSPAPAPSTTVPAPAVAAPSTTTVPTTAPPATTPPTTAVPTTVTTTTVPPPAEVATAPAPVTAQQGLASWYRHEPGACAHRTLPKGTIITVTNLATGASTTCPVVDRGPYVDGRIVDLEMSVFERIADLDDGVIEVRIDW